MKPLIVMVLLGVFGLSRSTASAVDIPTGRVTFEVVDAVTGESLAAEITIDEDFNPPIVATPHVSIELTTGSREVLATFGMYGDDFVINPWLGASHGESVTVEVVEGDDKIVKIAMTPPARARFRVVTDSDGTPRNVATVGVGAERLISAASIRMVADGSGHFEVEVPPAPLHPAILTLFTGEGASILHELEPIPSGSTADVGDLEAEVEASVGGRVVDSSGNPVAGAKVIEVRRSFGSLIGYTDADGRYLLPRSEMFDGLAVFPPQDSDLAAASFFTRGLWQGTRTGSFGGRHGRNVDFILEPGRFFPAGGPRIEPTAASPVTVAVPLSGSLFEGVNILDPRPGEPSSSFIVEYFGAPQAYLHAVLDVHDSVLPPGHRPALDVDCYQLECAGPYASIGPWGQQLVVGLREYASVMMSTEQAGQQIFIDPPLIVEINHLVQHDVIVSDPSGCSTELSSIGTIPFIDPIFSAPVRMIVLGREAGSRPMEVNEFTIAQKRGKLVYVTGFPGESPGAAVEYRLQSVGPTCVPVPPSTTTTTTTSTTIPTSSTTTTTATTTTAPPPITTTTTTTTSTTLAVSPASGSSTSTTTAPVTTQKAPEGYLVVSAGGDVRGFGDVSTLGGPHSTAAAVSIVVTSTGDGYWILTADGVVQGFGDAKHFGNAAMVAGDRPAALAARREGDGYWVISAAGRVRGFGAAQFHGDLRNFQLNGDIIDAAASGAGYLLVGADGGLFAFGDARFVGSVPEVLPGVRLNQPVVGITADPDGSGYWLVAADGGVFGFEAPFRGSLPGILPPGSSLVAPINGMVPYGNGYLLVAGDGGVFNISDRTFLGSLGGSSLSSPIVAISAV